MDFQLTEQRELIRETARAFFVKEFPPARPAKTPRPHHLNGSRPARRHLVPHVHIVDRG